MSNLARAFENWKHWLNKVDGRNPSPEETASARTADEWDALAEDLRERWMGDERMVMAEGIQSAARSAWAEWREAWRDLRGVYPPTHLNWRSRTAEDWREATACLKRAWVEMEANMRLTERDFFTEEDG